MHKVAVEHAARRHRSAPATSFVYIACGLLSMFHLSVSHLTSAVGSTLSNLLSLRPFSFGFCCFLGSDCSNGSNLSCTHDVYLLTSLTETSEGFLAGTRLAEKHAIKTERLVQVTSFGLLRIES